MNELRMLALADDLTGALETGAKFGSYGLSASVLTKQAETSALRRSAALVYDTETRHASPQKAYERIVSMQEDIAHWPEAIRFKKTDSTLRGNICAELQAMALLHPGRSIVYCPAYPAMGRIVRDGHVYVNAVPLGDTSFRNDLLNPVTSGCVASLFGSDCTLPVCHVSPHNLILAPEPVLYICDGESEDDIDTAARFIVAHQRRVIGAGPAALAEALAKLISQSAKRLDWQAIRSCLVVSGSLHPASETQIIWAESNGIFAVGDNGGARSSPAWTIFRYESASQGLERAAALGQQLLRLLRDDNPDAMLVFGGDTAYGLVCALGLPILHSVGEPVTGVALSRIDAADLTSVVPERNRDLYLLTKAGGFGSSDLIHQLQSALTSERAGNKL